MGISKIDELRLLHGWGYRPDDIEAYGFTRGRSPSDAGRFLGADWFVRHVRPVLNADRTSLLTEDKWVFSRYASGFGLPVPTTFGLFDPGYGVTWDGERPLRTVHQVREELERLRPEGLVLKPAGGGQGANVTILDDIDHATGEAVTRSGESTTLDRVLAGLDLGGMRGVGGYVLQEPLRNHEVLARLAPWTTNTARVLTILTRDGVPHVQATAARLGRQGGTVDNVSAGGVGVPVDTATGALGLGLTKEGETLTHHPDTGVKFTGVELPWWAETLELCLRSATLFRGLRSIGWDVVMTPEGPVLLEANILWSLRGLQVYSDGWLADPVIRTQLEDAGVSLPTGRPTRDVLARLKDGVRKRLGAGPRRANG